MDDHARGTLNFLECKLENALAGNSYGVFSFLITVF